MHRNISDGALAGSKIRLLTGVDKTAPKLREGVLHIARVILIVAIVTLGQLPIRAAQGKLPPTTRSDTSVQYDLPDLQHFLGNPASRQPFAVEIKESDYQREAEAEKQRQLAKARESHTSVKYVVSGFAAGNCTAYVAVRFPVTWSGDAAQWPKNARANGYLVDKNPQADTVLVTTENSWGGKGRGHVVYIEAVVDGQIYVSEQNYEGWGIVSHRTIPLNSPLIGWVIHRI